MQKSNTLDDKIQRLIEWNNKYPKVKVVMQSKYWIYASKKTKQEYVEEELRKISTSEEEYKELLEQYKNLQKDYTDIRLKNNKGKLTEEQKLICKEGGIGGVFGYTSKIEKIAKEYGQKEGDVEYILNNYGSMGNFTKLRIEGKSVEPYIYLRGIFDIDGEDNGIKNKKDSLVLRSIAYANEKKVKGGILLYSGKIIEQILQELPTEAQWFVRDYILKADIENQIGKEIGREEYELIKLKIVELIKELNLEKASITSLKEAELISNDEQQIITELEELIINSNILWNKSKFPRSNLEPNYDIDRYNELIEAVRSIVDRAYGKTIELQMLKSEKLDKQDEFNSLLIQNDKAKELLEIYNKIIRGEIVVENAEIDTTELDFDFGVIEASEDDYE